MSGVVLSVIREIDEDDDALYEVHSDGDEAFYELDDILEILEIHI